METMKAKRTQLSDQVRQAIDGSGESRYAICKATGLDPTALSRFMSGERGISTTMLDTLADYLELDIVSRRRTSKARLK